MPVQHIHRRRQVQIQKHEKRRRHEMPILIRKKIGVNADAEEERTTKMMKKDRNGKYDGQGQIQEKSDNW